ncbi:MAG: hypothetical protein KAI84_06715 [Gammaproteobacteria bacterium]|nr:hypothetical protein [Gammaproteobacteria bacterium]
MSDGIIFEDDFDGTEPTGKTYDTILSLVDDVSSLNATKKMIEGKIAMKRSELETLVGLYEIKEVETDKNTLRVLKMRRFKEWDNEAEVFSLIPRKMQTMKTLAPNKKKIEALIEKGKLPHEILDHQVITEFNQLRFKAV